MSARLQVFYNVCKIPYGGKGLWSNLWISYLLESTGVDRIHKKWGTDTGIVSGLKFKFKSNRDRESRSQPTRPLIDLFSSLR